MLPLVAEAAVLKVTQTAVRVRLIGEDEPVTIRALVYDGIVPGEIATVDIAKRWRFSRHDYASGRITAVRLDVARLGLVPLPLHDQGAWLPTPIEPDEIFGVSAAVHATLPRTALPECEMEQIIPGEDPDDPDWGTDPAILSSDLANAGDMDEAAEVLARAVALDLRYLDGHAHMGNLLLRYGRDDYHVGMALRHYAVGAAIGRSFLPPGFSGYLRAGSVNNRPFHRCLHGLALCQGAAGDHAAAERTLRELLRYDPEDRSGAEQLLDELGRGDTSRWLNDRG